MIKNTVVHCFISVGVNGRAIFTVVISNVSGENLNWKRRDKSW